MAAHTTLKVLIAKIDSPVFTGEASAVVVPGVEGEMTILPRHTAIISPLRKGVITVKTEGGDSTFDVESGTLEMSGNELTILI